MPPAPGERGGRGPTPPSSPPADATREHLSGLSTVAGAAPVEQRARPTWGLRDGDEIAPGRTILRRIGGGRRFEVFLVWDDHRLAMLVAKVLRPDQVEHPQGLHEHREAEAVEDLGLARELVQPLRMLDLVRPQHLRDQHRQPVIVPDEEDLEAPAAADAAQDRPPRGDLVAVAQIPRSAARAARAARRPRPSRGRRGAPGWRCRREGGSLPAALTRRRRRRRRARARPAPSTPAWPPAGPTAAGPDATSRPAGRKRRAGRWRAGRPGRPAGWCSARSRAPDRRPRGHGGRRQAGRRRAGIGQRVHEQGADAIDGQRAQRPIDPIRFRLAARKPAAGLRSSRPMEGRAVLAALVAFAIAAALMPVVARLRAPALGAVDPVSDRGLARDADAAARRPRDLRRGGLVAGIAPSCPTTSAPRRSSPCRRSSRSSGRSTTSATCRRSVKLLGQFAAALILVPHDVTVHSFTLPFVHPWTSATSAAPSCLLGLVALMNVVNFSDGIDGLGLASARSPRRPLDHRLRPRHASSPDPRADHLRRRARLPPHNFHPASVFMGDCGANLLGLLLGGDRSSRAR